jgi:hypothetical protein
MPPEEELSPMREKIDIVDVVGGCSCGCVVYGMLVVVSTGEVDTLVDRG